MKKKKITLNPKSQQCNLDIHVTSHPNDPSPLTLQVVRPWNGAISRVVVRGVLLAWGVRLEAEGRLRSLLAEGWSEALDELHVL